MLIFFNTIALGADDYEMVDSGVRKKPSKAHVVHTKLTLIKTASQLEKNSSIYGTTSTRRWKKKIYPHINEKTVRGFKRRYEAQIKDEIGKKKSPKAVVEFCQQIPRTFMFTWK